MAHYGDKEFLVLPPIPTILAAREDQIDRVVEQEDQRRVIRYAMQECDGFLMGGTTGHGPTPRGQCHGGRRTPRSGTGPATRSTA